MPLEKDVKNILDPILATLDKKLKTNVAGELAEIHISGTAEMVTWGKTRGGIPIAYEGPPIQGAIDWANEHSATLVKGMNQETKKRLAHTISRGIENKRGIPGLARDIRGTFADMSKHRSELIARTETASALSQASLDTMSDMEIDGKEWVTAGDDLVSDECLGNEAEGVIPTRQTFSGGVSAPPQHPDCRCAVAPAKLPARKGEPVLALPKDKPVSTIPAVSPKKLSAGDIATKNEWAAKNITSTSVDKATSQRVIDQIVREVPVKDLNTATRVVIGDPELRATITRFTGDPNRWRGVSGIFTEDKYITLASRQVSNTVTHEFGHAVMTSMPRGSISKIEKAFAFSKRKGVGFVSEYSKTNAKEYFAEAYRLYHTAPDVLKTKNEPIYNLLFKRYNP